MTRTDRAKALCHRVKALPPVAQPFRLSLVLCLLAFASPAHAAVTDYVGRTIVEVHVQSGGAELRDPRCSRSSTRAWDSRWR